MNKTTYNIEIFFIALYGKILFAVGAWWIFTVCERWYDFVDYLSRARK